MPTPVPRILVNSLPKSGTHLLTRCVELLGYREYFTQRGWRAKLAEKLGWGVPKLLNYRQAQLSYKVSAPNQPQPIAIGALSPFYVNCPTAHYWLRSIPAHFYISGHIPYTLELAEILAQLQFRHVLIVRDPRAVLVSQLQHILDSGDKTGMGIHFLHQDMIRLTPQQQLDFLLQGGVAKQAGLTVQDFRTVYSSMLAWRDAPGCLLVKFEDLVGEQGGGSAQQQQATVAQIAEHCGQAMPDQTRIEQIYSTQSRTFRSGKISSWQAALTATQVAQVNTYCAPLRRAAGYE